MCPATAILGVRESRTSTKRKYARTAGQAAVSIVTPGRDHAIDEDMAGQDHAIVIGRGIAGILTAAVLSEHFLIGVSRALTEFTLLTALLRRDNVRLREGAECTGLDGDAR